MNDQTFIGINGSRCKPSSFGSVENCEWTGIPKKTLLSKLTEIGRDSVVTIDLIFN